MIDIHSHILPNLDDGARSLVEALEMARIAADDGITHMVATPHMFNGISHDPEPDEVVRRVAELQEHVGSGLKILPGNEVHVTHDVPEKLAANKLTRLNQQNYMLIEFPTMHIPIGADLLFKKLQTSGVVPILVHPERNMRIQQRPGAVEQFVRSGVRIQVTAMSVTGRFGSAALKCAQTLLKHRCVHFLATDTHRPERRPPILSEAREAAARIVGAEESSKLVEDHPRAVIEGRTFDIADPKPFKR
jgi:protein-tyrosine phosphatase